MPESPYQLTVRVVLNPAVPAEAGDAGKYRWDRILMVLGLVAVSLGLLGWLTRSPGPAAPEAVAVAPAPAADAALDVSVTAQETAPELATQPPATVAAQPPAEVTSPDPARVEEPSTAEPLAQPPDQVDDQSFAEPAAAPAGKIAMQPPAGEQASAAVAERAVAAEPQVAAPASSSDGQVSAAEPPASSEAAAGSALRNPPVTAVATRIVSADVRRFLITDRVEAREPVGDISDIREDRKVKGLVKVIAYSDVAGRAGEFLEYRWIRGDRLVAKVPVGVGSDSWRSYTSKFLNKDMRGDWRVELRTRGGELLAETAFEY
jgi:hypothetical protein